MLLTWYPHCAALLCIAAGEEKLKKAIAKIKAGTSALLDMLKMNNICVQRELDNV